MKALIGGMVVLAVLLTGTWVALRGIGSGSNDRAALEAVWRDGAVLDRVAAGEKLLELDENRHDLRLGLAGLYLQQGRARAAASVLQPTLEDAASPLRIEAQRSAIEALLTDLEQVTARASRSLEDRTAHLERVSGAVRALAGQVQAAGGSDAATVELIAEARLLDLEMALHRQRIEATQRDLDMALTGQVYDRLGPLRTAVQQYERNAQKTRAALARALMALRTADPASPWPATLEVRHALRDGRWTDACQHAEKLAKIDPLPAAMAGNVALALLENRAALFGQPAAEAATLAEQLLSRIDSDPAGADLLVSLARARLAVNRGDWVAADRLTQALLEAYPGHIRARLLRGWTLVGLGRTYEALDMLSRLRLDHPTPEVSFALGMAYLGQPNGLHDAIDALNRACEADPQLLPAQIQRGLALMAAGQVLGARPVIDELKKQAPDDPRVRTLDACFALEQQQPNPGPLLQWFSELSARDALLTAPTDALLVAAMVLDDQTLVDRWLPRNIASRDQPVSMLAGLWRAQPVSQRYRLASTVARGVALTMTPDPMQILPPAVPEAMAVLPDSPVPPAARRLDPDALRRNLFVAWPHEDAMQVVNAAAGRWPDAVPLEEVRAHLWFWLGERVKARKALDHVWSHAASEDVAPVTLALRDLLTGNAAGLVPAKPRDAQDDRRPPPSATMRLIGFLAAADHQPETAPDALEMLLSGYPSSELGLLAALHRAIADQDSGRLDHWMRLTRVASPDLAHPAEIRLMLLAGKAKEAAQRALALQQQGWGDGPMRLRSLDLFSRAQIQSGEWAQAARSIELRSRLASPQEKPWMLLAVLDVHLAADRPEELEAAAAACLASDPGNLRLRDAVLMRLQGTLPAAELRVFLTSHPLPDAAAEAAAAATDLWHLAEAHRRDGDTAAAEQAFAALLEAHPQAHRARWSLAELAREQQAHDEAASHYRLLAETGTPLAVAAKARLDTIP